MSELALEELRVPPETVTRSVVLLLNSLSVARYTAAPRNGPS